MKKYMIILFLFMSQFAFSQEIQNIEFKYDREFKPYVEMTVKNSNNKYITNIEFSIAYHWIYGDMWDVLSYKYEKKMVQVNIPANSSKFISFYVSNIEDYKLSNVNFSRIRFGDSTIMDFNKRQNEY